MKKTSSFQIALLSAFGGLAIAGVLIFSFFISRGEGAAVGPVTMWGTFDEPTIQQLLSDLSSTHPDLLNITYTQKNADSYEQDLVNAFASGESPDLFVLTDDQAYEQKNRVNLFPTDMLAPALFDATFIDGAAPFMDPEGTIALPILTDPMVMYWNKDLLAAAGFSQPPKYWDEMLAFAQRVTRKSETGTIELSAIPFGGYSNVDHAKDLISMLILQAGGNVTTRDTNGQLVSSLLAQGRSSAEVAAAPSALRFYTEYADPSKPDYTWNRSFPRSRKAFTDSSLALYFGRASELPALRAANPNLNMAMAPMPQIQNGGVAATGGLVYGIAMPKAAKNPEGARHIQWLLAGEEVSAALSEALDLPSARRDVLDLQRRDNLTTMIATQAVLVRSWTDPNPQKTEEIFRAMIDDMTSGAILLSEAITRADQEMNALIDN